MLNILSVSYGYFPIGGYHGDLEILVNEDLGIILSPAGGQGWFEDKTLESTPFDSPASGGHWADGQIGEYKIRDSNRFKLLPLA